MITIKEKLDKIVSNEPSNWLEKAEWRVENEEWLGKSAKIALIILRTLRNKGITQKDLADKLNVTPQQVNKIVKGEENLTLDSISKIEMALSIRLIDIPDFQTNVSYTPVEIMPKYYHKTEIKLKASKYDEVKQFISDEESYTPLRLVS